MIIFKSNKSGGPVIISKSNNSWVHHQVGTTVINLKGIIPEQAKVISGIFLGQTKVINLRYISQTSKSHESLVINPNGRNP